MLISHKFKPLKINSQKMTSQCANGGICDMQVTSTTSNGGNDEGNMCIGIILCVIGYVCK